MTDKTTLSSILSQGNAALTSNDYSTAILHFSSALELDPSNNSILLNRFTAFLLAKQYSEARDDAHTIVERSPEDYRGHVALAVTYLAKNKTEKAVREISESLKIDPQNEVALDLFNKLRSPQLRDIFKDEDFSDVVQAGNENDKTPFVTMVNDVRQNPNNIFNYLGDMSLLEILQKLIEKNIKSFDVKIAPFSRKMNLDAEKHRKSGYEMYEKKKYKESMKSFEEAIKIDPRNVFYKSDIIAVLIKQKKYEEALHQCRVLLNQINEINVSPSFVADLYQRMSVCHTFLGNFEEALKCIIKSLEIKETEEKKIEKLRLESLVNRKLTSISIENKKENNKLSSIRQEAIKYFKARDFNKAIELFSEAISLSPLDPTLYSNRASAFSELNRNDDAIMDCTKAIEIDPNFVRGNLKMAKFYFRKDDCDKSIEFYRRALNLDPKNQEAIEGLKNVDLQKMRMTTNLPQYNGSPVVNGQRADDPYELLNDPQTAHILEEIRRNPQLIDSFLLDPGARTKLEALRRSGIL